MRLSPFPRANFQACEIRQRQPTSSTTPAFIRLVWSGSTVYTATGVRGAGQESAIRPYPSSAYAREVFNQDWAWHTQGGDCTLAYLSPPFRASRAERADPDATLDAHWEADAHQFLTGRHNPHGHRHTWVQIDGLARSAPFDPGAAAALAYLQAAPHYQDIARDSIIGQVGRTEREGVSTDDVVPLLATLALPRNTKLVAPITPCTHATPATPCGACHERMPELLAYQLRDLNAASLPRSQRVLMVDTARRLAHRQPAAKTSSVRVPPLLPQTP